MPLPQWQYRDTLETRLRQPQQVGIAPALQYIRHASTFVAAATGTAAVLYRWWRLDTSPRCILSPWR